MLTAFPDPCLQAGFSIQRRSPIKGTHVRTHFEITRTLLSSAVLIALLSPSVRAGVVAPDETRGVAPGATPERWLLQRNSTLVVSPDGRTLNIEARAGSTVSLQGAIVEGEAGYAAEAIQLIDSRADISGSTITHATRTAISLGSLAGAADPGSHADIQSSTITGAGLGAIQMGGESTLSVVGSTVRGIGAGPFGGNAIWNAGGKVEVSGASTLIGEHAGIFISSSATVVPDGRAVVIDGSTVQGLSGAAIVVQTLTSGARQDANILVRNGSVLAGGDGNLLEVRNALTAGDASVANFQVESSVVNGNVVAEDMAEANVTLLNGGRINGRFDNVTSATIGDGGHWQLTGDSDVGALSLGTGGVVALGDGTAFNTLTVTGDYTGSGGALLFNTVLGDDTAASDKLIVNGSTSGQTRVAVNNVGGIGAQTINGIQLIQVDGASNGQFDLAGRAVGGQYEYFLFKGGKADPNDGDWYLRSELPVAPPEPDPCLADPNAPGCVITLPEQCLIDPSLPQCLPPVPVLRPEPGAYLANQSAAVQMFGTRFHDRNGGIARGLSERGAWARVSRNQADYGVIGDQLSVNGDTDVLQVGTDVFTWGAERGQLGVMLGSGRANNTITSRLTGYSAKGKVEGQAIGIYGSWLQDPAQTTGLYVDAWAQHARFKNSVQGDGLSKERYDSTANSASVEAGYGVQVADGERVAMFVEPQLQLSYTRLNTDTHVERNGTVIDGNNADGLTSRVGVRFFGHAHTDSGNRVQPFVSVNWIRESNENSLRFDGEQLSGGLPQNRYEAKAGASLQLGGRWTAWGDLGLQRGDGGYKDVAGQVGLRTTW